MAHRLEKAVTDKFDYGLLIVGYGRNGRECWQQEERAKLLLVDQMLLCAG
jgi:hypothetical protein